MIYADYHIHCNLSRDAKSTVEDNIKVAESKGLKQIAVLEHCYYHMYGIQKGDLQKFVSNVDRAKRSTTISVLKAMEANLIDQTGKIDLSKSEQDMLDIVVLGYHKSAGRGTGFFGKMKHAKMRKNNPKNIELNTKAYITALENNKINIIAHPNYACPIDVVEIAKYCKEHNIYFELNGRKHCIDDKTFRQVIETGVLFILNSDAHSSDRVGDVRLGLTVMEKFNIPEWQIANLNKLPDFSKRK